VGGHLELPIAYRNLAEILAFDFDLDVDDARVTDAWGQWITESDLVFGDIVVPAGAITDGASVPKPLRGLYASIGEPWFAAAVAHDWLYAEQIGTRANADRVYRDLSLALGTRRSAALVQYVALRLFGWAAWRANGRKLELRGSNWRTLTRFLERHVA
jgi:hypothetical protein